MSDWVIDTARPDEVYFPYGYVEIHDREDVNIQLAIFPLDEANAGQAMATARRFLAVDDLLAACKLAIHKIEQAQQGQCPEGQALGAARNALVEAIAKAEGG